MCLVDAVGGKRLLRVGKALRLPGVQLVNWCPVQAGLGSRRGTSLDEAPVWD